MDGKDLAESRTRRFGVNLTANVADAFIDALRIGAEEDFVRLRGFCGEKLEFKSSVSAPTTGAEKVLDILQSFRSAGRFARATAWRFEQLPEGLTVTAEMPLSSFYERYEWDISVDSGGKIVSLIQRGIAQTEPLPPSPLHLTDEIADALTAAREARNPVILAYVDLTGRPNQSPRGTTQVLSKTQLAFWNHNPEGSFIRAVRTNPSVSIHYWGGIGNTFGGALAFAGIASISDEDSIRHKVYNGSPESERRSDPNQAGCPVIVDLERVTGFLAGTRYNMDARTSEAGESMRNSK